MPVLVAGKGSPSGLVDCKCGQEVCVGGLRRLAPADLKVVRGAGKGLPSGLVDWSVGRKCVWGGANRRGCALHLQPRLGKIGTWCKLFITCNEMT